MTLTLHRVVVILAVAALGPAGAATSVRAQKPATSAKPPAAPPAASGGYTEAQATRGAALYAENCGQCHSLDLAGGDLAPALTGPAFTVRWTSRPLSDVFDYMRTQMPLNSPGGLSAQQNADLLAFLLKKAGYTAGATDLPAASDKLAAVKLAPR